MGALFYHQNINLFETSGYIASFLAKNVGSKSLRILEIMY